MHSIIIFAILIELSDYMLDLVERKKGLPAAI